MEPPHFSLQIIICKHNGESEAYSKTQNILYVQNQPHQGALWKKLSRISIMKNWKLINLPKSLKNTCEEAQFQQSCRPKTYNFIE